MTDGEMPPCLHRNDEAWFYANELHCYANLRVGSIEQCDSFFNPEFDQYDAIDAIDKSDGATKYDVCLKSQRASFYGCMLTMELHYAYSSGCSALSLRCYEEHEETGDDDALQTCLAGVQSEEDACKSGIRAKLFFSSLVADDPVLEETSIVYEDAEDSSVHGWDIYDNNPEGAVVDNVYDKERASRVIELTGSGRTNGYRLRDSSNSRWNVPGNQPIYPDWNDTKFKVIEWSMRYSESFTVYIAVQTTDGFRYIYYTPATSDKLGGDKYVHHGLGRETTDGNWHTITRDLDSDLKDAQPDNEIEAVLGFLIRGSGRVDDIRTRKTMDGAQ